MAITIKGWIKFVFKMKAARHILWGGALLMSFSGIHGAFAEMESKPDSCKALDETKIIVGDRRFVIPAGLEADLIFNDDNQTQSDVGCLGEQVFIDVDGFGFKFFDLTGWSDVGPSVSEVIQKIYPVQIIVRSVSAADEHPALQYFNGLLEMRDMSYETLSFDNGLFCLEQNDVDTISCIASSDFLSPVGKPLVYQCGSPTRGLREGRWVDIGRSCSSSYYLSGELMITVRFRDGAHPKDTWLSHGKDVRAFVEAL